MFNDIGRKIKTVAMIACWLGIIGSIILAISEFVVANELSNSYSRYSDIIANEIQTSTTTAWTALLAGPLAAWLVSLPLYGFGEAIEHLAAIRAALKANNCHTQSDISAEPKANSDNAQSDINAEPKTNDNAPPSGVSVAGPTWRCIDCNQINPQSRIMCSKCGKVRP